MTLGTSSGTTSANRVLRPYLRRHVRSLAGAGGCTVALTVASLASPWPLKFVIDELLRRDRPFALDAGDFALLTGIVLLILAIAAVSALAQYYAEVWLRRSGEQIVHELRVALYDHLQRLSLAFHDTQQTGNLVTRLTGDVSAVGQLFSESLGRMASAVLLLLGMALVSLAVDPVLAVAVLGVTPVLFVVTSRYKGRLKELARQQRAEEGEIASLANESLSAMRVVKAFGSERFEHERVERRSRIRLAIGVLLSRTEARFGGLIDVLGAVATAVVVVVGVFRVASGRITPGDLVVFASYASRTYKPLKDIARQLGKISQSLVRADRVAEVLATDGRLPESREAYRGGRATGELQVHDVWFRYPDSGDQPRRSALRGVSVRIAAGSRVAVVGSSGAGKSTLAALVARFYDPGAGSVWLDGRDVRDCALPWLRGQVGFLLQDTVLFSGTVAANIGYATDAPLADVVAAARIAQAHDFITALPAGYETELGPRGVGLSGGQRQRLGIARVLLRDPPVLILDEPTTGLDAESEAAVLAGLSALMRDRTTIVVTHSIALARAADRVLVFSDGRIVEDGPPDQLLAEDGAFRRLAEGDTTAPEPAPPAPPATVPAGPELPPPDPELPELVRLLEPDAIRPALARSLPSSNGSASNVAELRIGRVRYQPRERVIVHYRVVVGGRERHAVATAIAGQDLAAKVRGGRYAELAARVRDRCPDVLPAVHDPELNAIVSWLPLDVRLSGLAAGPAELADRLIQAGLPMPEAPGEPLLLGYKPGSRAVLRFGGYILKAYGRDRQFRAAVTGLVVSGGTQGLSAPPLRAAFDDLRVTVQPALAGRTPAEAVHVAGEAGSYLRHLHSQHGQHGQQGQHGLRDAARLSVAAPGNTFAEANRHARLAGTVVPDLVPRLRQLVDRLTGSMPASPMLVPSHGDFHVDQLLQHENGLTVVDFDDMCLASAALDLASFAADVVRGRDTDLDRVCAVLGPLLRGYGGAPDGLSWYLSTAVLCRATHPFRAQTPGWPERVRATVYAAEEVLRI